MKRDNRSRTVVRFVSPELSANPKLTLTRGHNHAGRSVFSSAASFTLKSRCRVKIKLSFARQRQFSETAHFASNYDDCAKMTCDSEEKETYFPWCIQPFLFFAQFEIEPDPCEEVKIKALADLPRNVSVYVDAIMSHQNNLFGVANSLDPTNNYKFIYTNCTSTNYKFIYSSQLRNAQRARTYFCYYFRRSTHVIRRVTTRDIMSNEEARINLKLSFCRTHTSTSLSVPFLRYFFVISAIATRFAIFSPSFSRYVRVRDLKLDQSTWYRDDGKIS